MYVVIKILWIRYGSLDNVLGDFKAMRLSKQEILDSWPFKISIDP